MNTFMNKLVKFTNDAKYIKKKGKKKRQSDSNMIKVGGPECKCGLQIAHIVWAEPNPPLLFSATQQSHVEVRASYLKSHFFHLTKKSFIHHIINQQISLYYIIKT